MKQIVHYIRHDRNFIEVGEHARVVPLDHPSPLVTNHGTRIYTSIVIRKENDGEFETQNTIYRPVDKAHEEMV